MAIGPHRTEDRGSYEMAGDNSRKVQKVDNNAPLSSFNAQIERDAPAKRAAALSYDPEKDDAPILAAFGEGHLAEKIVEIAKESGVPIVPDPTLSSLLSKIGIGDEIPEELYEAVARVLLFVSEVDSNYGDRIKNAGTLKS